MCSVLYLKIYFLNEILRWNRCIEGDSDYAVSKSEAYNPNGFLISEISIPKVF
jgi:hypothetical protein